MTGDLGTMKARIADDLNRSDLTTQIATAISNAITFYERERFWFNEAATSLSTTANTQTLTLPANYMYHDYLSVTANGQTYSLIPRTYDYISGITVNSADIGQPTDYAIYRQLLWFYPIPDAIYPIPIDYIKSLSALANPMDTNAWMVEAEALIRYHAEVEVWSDVIRNKGEAQDCQAKEAQQLASLKRHTARYVSSGSIRAYAW